MAEKCWPVIFVTTETGKCDCYWAWGETFKDAKARVGRLFTDHEDVFGMYEFDVLDKPQMEMPTQEQRDAWAAEYKAAMDDKGADNKKGTRA